MRLGELRHGGDRPFLLDLHPQLTLLTGLGDAGRRWMAALFERVLRGELDLVTGTVDVHGVERQLTEALIAELELPADADVVVRAADLPGAEAAVPANDDHDGGQVPDLRTIANELAQARHALARATETRVHAERLLRGSNAAAVREALELADDLDAVHADLAALPPEPPAPPPTLVADAERELEQARAAVTVAEQALPERRVSAEDAARIEAAHAETMDAEEKAERRLAPPGTRKRLKELRDAELALLTPLGFTSYSDYLLSTSTLIVDPAAPTRLAEARRRLVDAEAVWDELTGRTRRAERERVEDRYAALFRHACDLLGRRPDNDGDVAGALRNLHTPSEAHVGRAALEADLAGARAAEQQAGVRVAQLEAATDAAEAEHERRRMARHAAADCVDAVIDLTAVERGPTEVYLLARIAAQRDVGQAGALPLVVVLGDERAGLSVETTQGVLDVVERFAPFVQMVLLSDDPAIEDWAASFGNQAVVRRFSFVPAAR